MVKLVSDTIDKDDIINLISWLSQQPTPKLTKGNKTKEFEQKWSKYLNIKHSCFVNSGSSGLLLMLSSLKEGGFLKNKKIIIPNLSWVTDVTSCINIGLEPILCDCNLYDLSIDLEHFEKLIDQHKPSALLLVSVLGLVPDMDKILQICKDNDVLLLEDYCESTGSKYKGKNLGTFGFASVTSTYFGHIISTIEGGIISTNNEEYNNLLLSMRSHGWSRELSDDKVKELTNKWNVDEFDNLYTFYNSGYNFRSTDLQAVIGLKQIDKLDKFVGIRNKNFKYYLDRLKDINILNINNFENNLISNFAFPFVHKNKKEIVNALIKNNVEVRPLISGSMGKQPFWVKKFGKIEFKNSKIIDKFGFYLPNHQNLTYDDVDFVVDVVKKGL